MLMQLLAFIRLRAVPFFGGELCTNKKRTGKGNKVRAPGGTLGVKRMKEARDRLPEKEGLLVV